MIPASGEEARLLFRLYWNLPVERIAGAVPPAEIQTWIRSLAATDSREQLLQATFQIAAEPASKEATIRDAVRDHKQGSPDVLCEWLERLGRFDLMPEFLDETLGRQSPGALFPPSQDLLANQGTKAAEAWLEKPHPDAPLFELSVFRVRLAQMRNDKLAFMTHWERAFRQAGLRSGGENSYPILYATALQMGDLSRAASALVASVDHLRNFLPDGAGVLAVMTFLHNENRLEDLRSIITRLLQSGYTQSGFAEQLRLPLPAFHHSAATGHPDG